MSSVVATSHMWLLNTWNMASDTEELNFFPVLTIIFIVKNNITALKENLK